VEDARRLGAEQVAISTLPRHQVVLAICAWSSWLEHPIAPSLYRQKLAYIHDLLSVEARVSSNVRGPGSAKIKQLAAA
jgi:hypothetical protein